MNIQEAAKKAAEQDGYITRKKHLVYCHTAIQLTDTADCCIVVKKESSRRGWQPKAEDLIADDWEVITQKELNFLF